MQPAATTIGSTRRHQRARVGLGRREVPGLVRRRGWVVLALTVTTVAVAAVFAVRAKPAYQASAYAYVNSGASRLGPGGAQDAQSLATTYTTLIPKDTAVVGAVAQAVHEPPAAAGSGISVFVNNQTAVLELRYTSATPSAALAGARALANALAGTSASSGTVPAGTLIVIDQPSSASPANSRHRDLIPFGLLAGPLIGIAAMLAWERFDPRVDNADDLITTLGIPVSTEADLRGVQAQVVTARWQAARTPRQLGTGAIATAATPIALVAAQHGRHAELDEVRQALHAAASDQAGDTERSLIDLRLYGAPGPVEVGHWATIEGGFVVLVVTAGARARDVAEAAAILEEFGHGPDWSVLWRAARPRKHRQRP